MGKLITSLLLFGLLFFCTNGNLYASSEDYKSECHCIGVSIKKESWLIIDYYRISIRPSSIDAFQSWNGMANTKVFLRGGFTIVLGCKIESFEKAFRECAWWEDKK